MTPLAFICDAPTELNDVSVDHPPTSEHPIARLGAYRDPRYGNFKITRRDYDGWTRNLAERQNGRIPIDYDHQAETGSTKAAGWITSLRLESRDGVEYVLASIEWTPEGAEAVRSRYWLYVSPTFTQHYRDEQGRDTGPTLLGVALTNRPFLRKGMPAISLSEALEGAEMPSAEVESGSFDSPGVTDLSKFSEALKLNADADEATILTAIQTLADKAEQEPATDAKTLAEQAEAEGKVVLNQETVTKLQADATKGVEAAKELREMRFATAYDKALSDGKVDAKPETRERFRKFFEVDEATTLAELAERPQVVNLTAQGAGGSNDDAPEGYDPDRFRLDQRARAIMAEHNVDYVTALDRAVTEAEQVTA